MALRDLDATTVALAAATVVGLAFAEDYYVTPGGSAAWGACVDMASPCSWQTAMASAQADDTVYFRGGVYEPWVGNVRSPGTPFRSLSVALAWRPGRADAAACIERAFTDRALQTRLRGARHDRAS